MGRISESNWARVKYAKGGLFRFIGHLDTLRTIIRSLRRAECPIEYRGKYSPRPVISFSPALPLGIASTCEYIDVYFCENEVKDDIDKAILKLKEMVPDGIDIIAVEYIGYEKKKKEIIELKYRINYNNRDAQGSGPRKELGEMIDAKGRKFKMDEWVSQIVLDEKGFDLSLRIKKGGTPNPNRTVEYLLIDSELVKRTEVIRTDIIFQD